MAGGVYGWAENKSTEGPHRMVPVSYDQYIKALEDALIELAFICPPMGVRTAGEQDRPDNTWLNRVRKSLGLEMYGVSEVADIADFLDGSGVVRPEEGA